MVVERLKAVREFRAKSKRQTTRRLADYPSAYGVTVVPGYPFLIVPQTSSERRDYVPIDLGMEPFDRVCGGQFLAVLLGVLIGVEY